MNSKNRTFLTFFLLSALLVSVNAQNKLVGEVPFFMHGAHIIVQGSINGSETINFAFDTGAMSVIIDAKKGKSIGLSTTDKMPVMGANGKRMTVDRSDNNTIDLNGVKFQSSSLLLLESPGQSTRATKYDCVLGYPQFSQYITEFDYEKSVIRFYEKEGYQYQGKGKEVAIDLSMRIPMIDIEYTLPDHTKIKGKAMVDTGASMAASLNTPVTKQYNLIEKAKKLVSKIGKGATGTFVTQEGRINAVSFGGFQFDNVPTGFNTLEKGPKASTMYKGIVGNHIMKRFNITLDYENGKMYLEPNSKYNDDFKVNASGLHYAQKATNQNGYEVRLVDEGSPAAKLGIQKGDQILKIEGKAITEYGYNELNDLLTTNGKKLRIEWLSMESNKVQKGKITLQNLI